MKYRLFISLILYTHVYTGPWVGCRKKRSSLLLFLTLWGFRIVLSEEKYSWLQYVDVVHDRTHLAASWVLLVARDVRHRMVRTEQMSNSRPWWWCWTEG